MGSLPKVMYSLRNWDEHDERIKQHGYLFFDPYGSFKPSPEFTHYAMTIWTGQEFEEALDKLLDNVLEGEKIKLVLRDSRNINRYEETSENYFNIMIRRKIAFHNMDQYMHIEIYLMRPIDYYKTLRDNWEWFNIIN